MKKVFGLYVLTVALIILSSCTRDRVSLVDMSVQTVEVSTESLASEPAGGRKISITLDARADISVVGEPVDLDGLMGDGTIREAMAERMEEAALPSGAFVSSQGIYSVNVLEDRLDYHTATCSFPIVFKKAIVGRFILGRNAGGEITIWIDRSQRLFVDGVYGAYDSSDDERTAGLASFLESHKCESFTVLSGHAPVFLISDQNDVYQYNTLTFNELVIEDRENLFNNLHFDRTVLSYADVDPEKAWLVKK